MFRELMSSGKRKKFVDMGVVSANESTSQAEKDSSFAKDVVERIKNGEKFALRFDTIEIAKAVNSELNNGSVLEEGEILDVDVSAAKILRHYLEYPQDFSNITFPDIETMQSFFKLLPYGKNAVLGILQSRLSENTGLQGIKGETEDLSLENKSLDPYITKPISVQPTAEQDQDEIDNKRSEDLEDKKAA